jgi:hypothetical protein
MIELVRSKQTMTLAAMAAGALALGAVLVGIAYAVLSSPDAVSTTNNLVIAGQWLTFVGGLVALGAIKLAVWHRFAARQWSALWELLGLAISTLLIVIGLLVAALNKTDPSDGARVVLAIGVGGWAVALLIGAAQRALVEQESPHLVKQSTLRLASAGAVVLLAIGAGLPEPSSAAPAITKAVIGTIGFAGLAVVLTMARDRQLITTRVFPSVVIGLWAIVASGIAVAVSSGFIYGPSGSLLWLRIGVSVSDFIYALAFLFLGWAAFTRLPELAGIVAAPEAPTPSDPTTATAPPPSDPGPDEGNSTQPSWHPDPSGRHEARWWDGVRWTEHVQDQGRPSLDPPQ